MANKNKDDDNLDVEVATLKVEVKELKKEVTGLKKTLEQLENMLIQINDLLNQYKGFIFAIVIIGSLVGWLVAFWDNIVKIWHSLFK